MQSLPPVSSTQSCSASTASGSNPSNPSDGPQFAQVLNEQASRSTAPASSEAQRAASTSANANTNATTAPGASSNGAAGASAKKTSAALTHAGDSLNRASPTPAPPVQSDPSAAAVQAAANAAQTRDAASDGASAQRAASGSVLPAPLAISTSNPANTAGVATASNQAGDEEDLVPVALSAAKDEADDPINLAKDDRGASTSSGASAALHSVTTFSASLAQAKAYLGGDNADRKDDSESGEGSLHLIQAGSTAAPLVSVTPTAVPGTTASDPSSAPAVASASVPYQMGTDAWRADLAGHVLYFTQQNLQQAQLHLNPAHLGPLEVTIKSENNQTTLAFSAAQEATRQAMQDSLPQLKHLFAAQGVALGNTTVSDQSQGSGNTRQEASDSRSLTGSQSAPSASAVAAAPIALSSLSMVDTFA